MTGWVILFSLLCMHCVLANCSTLPSPRVLVAAYAVQEEEASQLQQAAAGRGWGGWGAFNKLSAKIQAAATTAVRDVSELTESFQQVGC